MQAEDSVGLRTEIITLSVDDAVGGLYFWNGEKPVEFRSVGGGLGPPMSYRGPRDLQLFDSPEATMPASLAPGGAVSTATPVASVQLPEGAGRVLLLTRKQADGPLRLLAFPASFNEIQTGDYRFFNFSSHDVRILLDDETELLPSGQGKTFSNRTWQRNRKDLDIQLGATIDGQMRLVFSSVWGHNPDLRYFVMIFDGVHISSPLILRKVHDRLPPPPEEP